MSQAIALFMLGLGLILLLLGLKLSGLPHVQTGFYLGLACGISLTAGLSWLSQVVHTWREKRRIEQLHYTPLAVALTPHLQGEDLLLVIEAAEKLGAARDVSAVPDLIAALEECVETQRLGWRERAASLAEALAQIGDRRALPLLYRLDNVRGIGFIPAVRNAIAAIEPQTSLLRAGDADRDNHMALLRALQSHAPEEPAILLRSADADTTVY